jgi:hypothetical protein
LGRPVTTRSTPSTVETGAAIFELERFEWTAPDRLELTGVWMGLRARRFIRPTLVLDTDAGRRRLLALLEHKPWSADDGADWIAAFAWTGEPAEVLGAQLNAASGVDIELPAPRRPTGNRPPRRFRHRAVSRDASRDDAAAPAASGGVVAPPAEIEQSEPPGATAAPEPPVDEPGHAEAADAPTVEEVLERAQAAELRVGQLVTERDEAVARRKSLAAELSSLKQSHEQALSRVRAQEREIATKMLAEGAELRARVETERGAAYAARDAAMRQRDEAYEARDEAVQARERALEERKHAVAERKSALRERDKAFSERDRAVRAREEAIAAQEMALDERDAANRDREIAHAERDGVISAQQRGLPVLPAQPRHLPFEPERSPQEVWMPRAIAAGALALFLLVVIKLFAGL